MFLARYVLTCRLPRARVVNAALAGHDPARIRSTAAALFGVALGLGSVGCSRDLADAAPEALVTIENASPAVSAPVLLSDQSRAWIGEAEYLVKAAGSGRAEAGDFKRRVESSRESLRAIMRAVPVDDRDRYHDMVLMVALLDAAAACHKAGYIICPPDLMQQLRAQQQRLQASFGTPI